MSTWDAIHQPEPSESPAAPAPPSPADGETMDPGRLYAMAQNYGRVLIAFAVLLICNLLTRLVDFRYPDGELMPFSIALMTLGVFVAALAALVFVIIFAWKLSTPVGWSPLLSLLSIIPLVGLIYLAMLTNAAKKQLNARGVRAGILCVPTKDMRALKANAARTTPPLCNA